MSYSSRIYRHRNAHTHENDNDSEQSSFFKKSDPQSGNGKKGGSFFQAKLNVNEPGDKYEREANAAANTVVNSAGQVPVVEDETISNVQRKTAGPYEEKKESVQRLATAPVEDKISTDEERMKRDKEIQTKPDVQLKCDECEKEEEEKKGVQRKAEGGSTASAHVSSRIEQSSGKGKPLPGKTKAEMQNVFGVNLNKVTIHTDTEAAELSKEVKAQAFTHGSDIFFNSGKYNPDTASGKFLLAHELTHVIQQTACKQESIQRMAPCPGHLNEGDNIPDGWKKYYGATGMFHCDFRGILEDRMPTPEDPQNECFYDNAGTLVTESHPNAGCRGTPNSYDSESNSWAHTWKDPGGIWNAGWGAFWASRWHDLTSVDSDWGTKKRRYPDGTWHDEDGNIHMGPGPKY